MNRNTKTSTSPTASAQPTPSTFARVFFSVEVWLITLFLLAAATLAVGMWNERATAREAPNDKETSAATGHYELPHFTPTVWMTGR